MRRLALVALLAAPVSAQVAYPPSVTQGDLAAVQAQIPQPASTAPPMEVVGGAAGSGPTFRRGDAVQPRISRTVGFTTAANGQSVVTWQDMGAVPKVYIQENITSGATNVPKCYPIASTISATGVTVACYITQSILGLGIVPFTTATAGISGQVLALPAS